jgi:hypothetical protein
LRKEDGHHDEAGYRENKENFLPEFSDVFFFGSRTDFAAAVKQFFIYEDKAFYR